MDTNELEQKEREIKYSLFLQRQGRYRSVVQFTGTLPKEVEEILLWINSKMKVIGNVLEGIKRCWTLNKMDLRSARMWQLASVLPDSVRGELRGNY